METKGTHKSRTQQFIVKFSRVANKFPHPAILFLYMTIFVLVVAHLLNGATFQIPGETEATAVTSLFNRSGLEYILTKMLTNFSGMSILPILIMMAAAVGVGEVSGFWEALIMRCFRNISDKMLVFLFLILCINGNLMSDASLIIFPVLGAMLFQGRGRSPLLGVMLAYCGYLSGLSANLLLASTDANVTAITQDVLPTLEITKGLSIHMASNYYFMAISAVVLATVGTFVTLRIVEPAINQEPGVDWNANFSKEAFNDSPEQTRGLKWAGITAIIYLALVLVTVIPKNGLLRNAETLSLLPKSPFMSSIVPLLAVLFALLGIMYGMGAGTMTKGVEVVNAMSSGIKSISTVLVTFFIAAQFMNYITKTNLASYIAVSAANWLIGIGLTGAPLIIAIVILVMVINLFAGSISAKWAMIASIIVPMMALLGYHPAYAQCVYRVGDALTNSVNPVMYYMPLILSVVQKYKKDAGVGTVLAYQFPYFIAFFVIWVGMLLLWYFTGMPLGPGAPVMIG